LIAALILLLSLGLDTFAVALGLGLSGLSRSQWVRVGLTFACFEGLMPVGGLLLGKQLSNVIGSRAGYIAAVLLIVVGAFALKEACSDDDDDDETPSLLDGNKLLLTGLSVSLDELAVGFSLGLLHVALLSTLSYIAIQAFGITFLGLALGARLGKRLGDKAEFASGIVLILLGIALLLNQITGSHFL
jgi:putative Mn2+ efflux pump MntP